MNELGKDKLGEDILVSHENGVLTIAFNRPARRNALTVAMYQAMADALSAAHDDASVRAVLFRGHRGRGGYGGQHDQPDAFTAGNDIEDFLKLPPAGEDAPVARFLRALAAAEKPLVAAVAGMAVGIGTTLLLHCDLVYAADTARFALPFVPLGLCPEAASSLLLPRVAGYQAAAEKLLLGEPFDAVDAHRMGFVTRVLPAAELDAFVATQLAKLVALPAASLRATKMLMKRASREAIAQQMAHESAQFAQRLASPEAKEAFSAFLQKRAPAPHTREPDARDTRNAPVLPQ